MDSRETLLRRSATVLRRLLTLVVLLVFMGGLRDIMALLDGGADDLRAVTVAVGFLLLAAFLAGKLAGEVRLPRITGYIVLGLVVGPGVLGLLTSAEIEGLRLIDDIAISLIALSAGGELKVSELRTRGRTMVTIMLFEMVAVFVVVAGAVLLLAGVLPFTQGRSLLAVSVIALIFGSIAIANSPSVAIAVINDTRSRGPVASTVLGVTVMKDVVVILFFAVALSVARMALSEGGGFDAAFLGSLLWETGGSVLFGALMGWLISVYLRLMKAHMVLLALGAAFLNAFLAAELHLEVLIVSLVAGFFVENVSPVEGEPFVQGVEANSLPLYALFFAIAGASIHLEELAALWPFAIGLVLARGGAVFLGTWLGARRVDAEPVVRRYAWLGFISQAGVTLGMVIIAARAFPEWGDELRTLFVSMVAIHELIGPILLQRGLERAGEVGARETPEAGRSGLAAARAAGAVPLRHATEG